MRLEILEISAWKFCLTPYLPVCAALNTPDVAEHADELDAKVPPHNGVEK